MAAPTPIGTPGAAVASPSSVPSPTTLTPPTGSGYAAGDLLLCFTALWGGFGASVSMSAGWTQLINTGVGTPPLGIALFGKIAASASEPAPNVVWNVAHSGSGGDPSMAQIAAFRGAANVADVVGAINTIASTFSQSAGGSAITTLTADDRVFSFTVRGGSGGNTLVAPSGFAMVATGVSTTSGITMTMGWASQAKAVPGSVGIPSFGFNGSSAQSAGVMMALKAAPVGIINNDVATGAIVFTGTRVETWNRTFNDLRTGTLALSGTSVDSSGKGFSDSPVGSLAFTANLVESFGHAFFDARTGALLLSGTSVDSWTVPRIFSDAPVGTLAVAGTCNATYASKDAVSGGIVIAGSVVEHPAYVDKPVGRIQLWDWAAEHPPNTPRPVGIPGALATSVLRSAAPGQVVNPTVLRPSTGSGYAVGDLLICFAAISIGGGNVNAVLASASSGWTITSFTPVPGTGGAIAHHLYLVSKLAASVDEPPPTLTFNTLPGFIGNPAMARIVAFKGIDTRDMASIFDAIGSSDLFTGPTYATGGKAVTTTLPNDLVITLSDILDDANPHTVQPPTGFTMLFWDSVDSGRGMQGGWAYQVKRTPGLTTNPSFTISGTQTNVSGGWQVALKAASLIGIISLSGSVQDGCVRACSVAGLLRLSGSLAERKGFVETPQGALPSAGSVVELYQPPTVQGTIKLTGTVQESWSHVGTVTGTLALSGNAATKRHYTDIASGTISINGTVTDQRRIADKCAGVLKLFGVLSHSLSVSTDVHGNVRLTGRNSEFIVIDETIYYSDFPGGLLEINGKTVLVDYTPELGRDGRVVSVLGPGRVVRGLDTGRVVGNLTGRLT